MISEPSKANEAAFLRSLVGAWFTKKQGGMLFTSDLLEVEA